MLLLLVAARPDNAGIAALFHLSALLVWPMSFIDSFQPVYGARFERGTLLECIFAVFGLLVLRKKT